MSVLSQSIHALLCQKNILSSKVVELVFEVAQVPQYQAGQYFLLRIPAYGAYYLPCYRPYTVASSYSWASQHGSLCFWITPGLGMASHYLTHLLQVGESIQLMGPFGQLMLQPKSSSMIIVAGTGFALAFAMLQQAKQNQSTSLIKCVWAGKTADDWAYQPYIDTVSDATHRQFFGTIEEPNHHRPHIGQGTLIEHLKDIMVQRDQIACNYYLAGSTDMIHAVKLYLATEQHIAPQEIFYDTL